MDIITPDDTIAPETRQATADALNAAFQALGEIGEQFGVKLNVPRVV